MIQCKDGMHSLRVAYENWIDEQRFCQLLALLEQYPCDISTVALFTSSTHSPLTIPETERRARIMHRRMIVLREHGFSAGINILATIGHHEEDLDHSLQGDFTYMTGRSGNVCRGSYCMNDTRFLDEYVRPVYTILANASPDFIWVDDDIRYAHMPVDRGCFCDGCLAKFNKQNHTAYTRKTLTEALDNGDQTVRRAWLSHNSNAIVGLFRVIRETVSAVDRNITLGFMTGERYAEGYDFKAFSDALSNGGKYEILWRPGGGAYTDDRFDEILEKTEQAGRQNALLPAYATTRHYEIECFPYQLITKTPTSVALEAAWSMTSGCTGAAFNMLPSETDEPIQNILSHLKEITRYQPLYRLLSEKIGGKQPVGIGTAWRKDSQLAVPNGNFDRLSGGMFSRTVRELYNFGLPQSYLPENAVVTVVTDTATAHWTQAEIDRLLSGGVYLDAPAVQNLAARGFADQIGFTVGGEIPLDAREQYVEHPLNNDIVGGLRNCRQAFHPNTTHALLPQLGAQILSRLVNYHDEELAPCAQGVFENQHGGRIAVGGYYPFTWVSDYYKSTQLKRMMVWLSNGNLPSYVDTYCRIRNHTFVSEDGCTVALLNPSNQPLKAIRIAVKTEKQTARCYQIDGKSYELNGQVKDGYTFFTVDTVGAYEMVVLEV